MSLCKGGLIKVTDVPQVILDVLHNEINNWDYIDDQYKYDKVFGNFKAKVYHAGDISCDIFYSPQIMPVINWLQQTAGPNQKVVRCFLNLMEPNQSFNLHVDTLEIHLLAKRFHIPIELGEGSTYYTYEESTKGLWKETRHSMEYGYLYQLDNIRPHNVKNKNAHRINLICDIINNDLINTNLMLTNSEQFKMNRTIFNNGLALDPLYL